MSNADLRVKFDCLTLIASEAGPGEMCLMNVESFRDFFTKMELSKISKMYTGRGFRRGGLKAVEAERIWFGVQKFLKTGRKPVARQAAGWEKIHKIVGAFPENTMSKGTRIDVLKAAISGMYNTGKRQATSHEIMQVAESYGMPHYDKAKAKTVFSYYKPWLKEFIR